MSSRGRPSNPLSSKKNDGPSALVEHLQVVPESERNRIADFLVAQKVRTYDDLSDVCMVITSEVARGTLSPELALTIKSLLDIVFTAVAATNRGKEASQANEAVGSLIAAIKESSSTPTMLPSYTTTFEKPTVVIDMVNAK